MTKNKISIARNIIASYNTKPTKFWLSLQNRVILEIYKIASTQVKAYKKFISHSKNIPMIISGNIVSRLPTASKKNYFHKFDLKDVAINKYYDEMPLVMTSTSGSTGKPTYFPRTNVIDWQYSVLAEYFLQNGPKGSTLLIDCFGMGVWIGGLITYQAFREASLRGHPVTIITPGINKNEIFHALKELAPNFKNVILAGYPPFIKDLLDESTSQGINFNKLNIRLLFAAESFTENFRDYVNSKAKVKNLYKDTLNIYGSAELGAMAFETPGSILIRRLALKNKKIFEKLFPNGGCPTLAQYNPAFVSFISSEGKILISAMGPVPFLNYDIGDTGGVYTLEQIEEIFSAHNINLKKEAAKEHITLHHLPFVYVDIRSDFSTKLYGAIIYPQPIFESLQEKKFSELITGKFTMLTKTDSKHDQFLEINIELKPGKTIDEKTSTNILSLIVENLLKNNAEYKNNYNSMKNKVMPILKFWPNGSPEYFKSGIKQKWVIK